MYVNKSRVLFFLLMVLILIYVDSFFWNLIKIFFFGFFFSILNMVRYWLFLVWLDLMFDLRDVKKFFCCDIFKDFIFFFKDKFFLKGKMYLFVSGKNFFLLIIFFIFLGEGWVDLDFLYLFMKCIFFIDFEYFE